jgi:hypothetical protein
MPEVRRGGFTTQRRRGRGEEGRTTGLLAKNTLCSASSAALAATPLSLCHHSHAQALRHHSLYCIFLRGPLTSLDTSLLQVPANPALQVEEVVSVPHSVSTVSGTGGMGGGGGG